MGYKYKIDVANIEDTETIVKFQLAMAKESEGTELDYETVREGVKAGIADDGKATYLVARNDNNEVLGSLMLTTEWSDWNNCNYYWIQSVYVQRVPVRCACMLTATTLTLKRFTSRLVCMSATI